MLAVIILLYVYAALTVLRLVLLPLLIGKTPKPITPGRAATMALDSLVAATVLVLAAIALAAAY